MHPPKREQRHATTHYTPLMPSYTQTTTLTELLTTSNLPHPTTTYPLHYIQNQPHQYTSLTPHSLLTSPKATSTSTKHQTDKSSPSPNNTSQQDSAKLPIRVSYTETKTSCTRPYHSLDTKDLHEPSCATQPPHTADTSKPTQTMQKHTAYFTYPSKYHTPPTPHTLTTTFTTSAHSAHLPRPYNTEQKGHNPTFTYPACIPNYTKYNMTHAPMLRHPL